MVVTKSEANTLHGNWDTVDLEGKDGMYFFQN